MDSGANGMKVGVQVIENVERPDPGSVLAPSTVERIVHLTQSRKARPVL